MTDVLANSLLLEQFLPNKPAAIGQSWKHGEKLMAMFLGLGAVTQCDVQSTLKEVTATVARFEIRARSKVPTTTCPPRSN